MNAKLLMVFAAVYEPSIYELVYGFYPYKRQNKGSGIEKFLSEGMERLHKEYYTRLMRLNLIAFKESEMGKYFVLRAIVNNQRQWVIKIFHTEQEYQDKQIDDRLDSVANGVRQSKKRDHNILAIPETERKKLIQEQIQQQRRKYKDGK